MPEEALPQSGTAARAGLKAGATTRKAFFRGAGLPTRSGQVPPGATTRKAFFSTLQGVFL